MTEGMTSAMNLGAENSHGAGSERSSHGELTSDDTPYNCLPNKRMAIKQVCCTSAAKTPEVSMPLRKEEQSFARIEGELLYCVSASTRLWSG